MKETTETRSRTMKAIHSRDTGPEKAIRHLVHGLGYRYRLHRQDMPGCPDLVFITKRKVIFVNGCFWHFHSGCRKARMPKTNRDYWQNKLFANQTRDKRNISLLQDANWNVLVIWECEMSDMDAIKLRITSFLN